MSRRNRGSVPVSLSSFDRRQFLRIFGAVAAVGATGGLTACAADPLTAGTEPQLSGLTVNIGVVAPKTGPYAKIGDDIVNGFSLFVAGRRGLLGTHNANLIVVDEGTTVESADQAVKGLLSQNVVAIAGVANPAALPTLANTVQEARVPLVSANAAPSTLTNALFVWRVSSVEGDSGRALAQYAKVEGNRTYLLYDETASGRAEAEAFRGAFIDVGGEIVGEAAGTGSLASRLQAARAEEADSIFASYSGADAAAVIDAYRASGATVKLLGTGSLTETIDLTKIGPLPAERVHLDVLRRRPRQRAQPPLRFGVPQGARRAAQWLRDGGLRQRCRVGQGAGTDPSDADRPDAQPGVQPARPDRKPTRYVDLQHQPQPAAEVVPAAAAPRRPWCPRTCSTPI